MSRHKKHNRRYLLPAFAAAALAIGQTTETRAQDPDNMQLLTYPSDAADMERADVMLNLKNFQGVIDQLRLDAGSPGYSISGKSAARAYMMALAAYGQNDPAARDLLSQFLIDFPSAPQTLQIRLAMADSYFFCGEFREALKAYNEIPDRSLSGDLKSLYTYRRALSMVKSGLCDESVPMFRSLLTDKEFSNAATFYLGYIEYAAGNYTEAKRLFRKVRQSGGETFQESDATTSSRSRSRSKASPSDIRRRHDYVPTGLEAGYYLTQIEFTEGKYKDVISHGQSLLQKTYVSQLAPEMFRIIGLSYFKTGHYDTAMGYLNNYIGCKDVTPASDAVYALGVIDYRRGDYEKAAHRLSTLTDERNALAQSACLYLGQCDVKRGNDTEAAIHFERAARMNFDPQVAETALYDYVAAITRGAAIPFGSSAEMLENFISSYPNSAYAPAVEEYLATSYYNDRNYARALASIDRIPKPSAKVMAARQKVLFELGCENVSNSHYKQASGYLSQAAAMTSQDPVLAAEAALWLGDALYAEASWNKAAEAYGIATARLKPGPNRTLALYNLAYALYMDGRYDRAAEIFSKATAATPGLPEKLSSDASLRRADCLYYTGDWRGAADLYSKAINSGSDAADYAWWRRAVMYGLSGDTSRKLSDLAQMEKRYPDSKWLSDAMLERGLTLVSIGQTDNAAKAFNSLSHRFPKSAQTRRGLLNMAVSYMKAGKTAKGAEAYKDVIRRWPGSEEAVTANDDLRRHYAATGDLEEYVAFLSSIPGAPRLEADEIERLSFEAAENAVADNAADTGRLEKFIGAYPDSRYLSRALLTLAEAKLEQKDHSGALRSIETLLDRRADSAEAPEALLMKGEILEKHFPQRTTEALKTWRQLEAAGGPAMAPMAYAGIMRTTTDNKIRVEYARKVQRSGVSGADEMDEARLYEALGLLRISQTDKAVDILTALAENPKSKAGSRAAVELGQYLLDSGQTDKAENVLTAFTSAGTPHAYWLARGFITLADVCRRQGRKSLALEYVRSLQENYPGSEKDIHDMISKRLKSWK